MPGPEGTERLEVNGKAEPKSVTETAVQQRKQGLWEQQLSSAEA